MALTAATSVEPVLETAVGRPGPAVARWVERYVGYRMAGYAPGVHTGMPSHRLTLIISLDEPVDIAAMPDPHQGPRRVQAPVSGLHTGPAQITHDGTQYGVSVDVTPLGARALFGLPGGELALQVVELDDLLGPAACSLPGRLRLCPTWRERFAVLDDVLARAVAVRRERFVDPPPEVSRAFGLIVASGGGCDIGRVAREVGWSRRHLAERFRQEVGVAPKAAARLVRFHRATELLASWTGGRSPGPHAGVGPAWTLADVAAAAGYADQAHFNREFRALAGRTPSRWLAEELPSVQDAGRAGDAS